MRIFLFLIFTSLIFSALGQLKVDASGNVGIGTLWPNPAHKLHVSGDILLTDYPQTPNRALRFKIRNPGIEISSSTDEIDFWEAWIGHHKLRAQQYNVVSDSSMKKDIESMENGLELIKKLRPVSYKLIDNVYNDDGSKATNYLNSFGFISQEVNRAFPNYSITSERKELMLMDYLQIIPITVSAIKEQEVIIDSLEDVVSDLISRIESLENNMNDGNSLPENETFFLGQNVPNPFDNNTSVPYDISKTNSRVASLFLFDLNGKLISEYDLDYNSNSVVVEKNDLLAGMYIYTLVIDNIPVATKRMILK